MRAAAASLTAAFHAVLVKTSSASRAAYNFLLSRYPPWLLSRLTFSPNAASLTSSLASISSSPLVCGAASPPPPRFDPRPFSPTAPFPQSSLLRSMPTSIALHVHTLAFKLVLSSPFSASCLVTLCSRPRCPDATHHLFDEIPVALSSTMHALSSALRAATGLAALEQACGIQAHAVMVGLDRNVAVGTALVDAYGKAGVVDNAQNVFEKLAGDTNLIMWNAVMTAHTQQGDVAEMGFVHDGLTFLALLATFSNAGAAKEAEFMFEEMQSKYKVDMAGLMGQQAKEIDPNDDSAYVVLANFYSAAGRTDEVVGAWTAMRDRGVRKEGGRSWIEVRGQLHMFVVNERRHEQMLDIYDKLNDLIKEVEKLGYKEVDKGAPAA
ncbi:hypothetical protein ABZP36_020190 [Zizania latifolia]